jgi:hypothetical protein
MRRPAAGHRAGTDPGPERSGAALTSRLVLHAVGVRCNQDRGTELLAIVVANYRVDQMSVNWSVKRTLKHITISSQRSCSK